MVGPCISPGAFCPARRCRQPAARPLHPILAACALLIFAVCARADSLRADFSPLTLRPRTNAPAIFDITLHRAGAGLLEGALEITLKSGNEVLLRQRTQELTLPAGAQSFRIITPPLPPGSPYVGTEAHLRFVTKKYAIDLGIFPVSATSRAARNFVLAVCDTHAAGGRDLALWQSLRLESFLPSDAITNNLIATAPAFFAPEDFPANPLALFAFDIVLLDGDGFALLREKQLAALTRWVEAGGSLCVLPGRGLKDEHLRFLNAFASAKDPAPFQMTDTGEFVPVSEPRLLRAGLGRVVVANRQAGETLAALEWQQLGAFLWKVNARGTKAPGKGQRWGWVAADENSWRQRSNDLEKLFNTLLPTSTRLISPSTFALILAGFLLVVGPLDYFLLGCLRRRRWTWVVFPLASAGFTGLVIFEAGRALGHRDQRAALTITDVGPGEHVLRESRFELMFAARNQVALMEFHNAFAVVATVGTQNFGRRGAAGNPQPVWFTGQIPAAFTLRQPLQQWTPQFNRVTSLVITGAQTAALPWAEIEMVLGAGHDLERRLKEIGTRHSDLGFIIYHRDELPFLLANYSEYPPRGIGWLCCGNTGCFLTSIAPDAAGDFDDLPLLDSTDKKEWLLVISQRTPDGVHLYRRLFRTDD